MARRRLEGQLAAKQCSLAVAITAMLLLAGPVKSISGQVGEGQQQMRQMRAANHRQAPVPLARQQQQQREFQQQQMQQTSPDAPKLIPLSALDRYQEGADLRLFCSASAAPNSGRLHFEWRKDQLELRDTSTSVPPMSGGANLNTHNSNSNSNSNKMAPANARLSIQLMDESASVLRINQLDQDDSGNYTCLVRNQHGQDASTVRINVAVKLKWLLEPPGQVQLKAGQSLQLECDAAGQPEPQISWTSLKDSTSIQMNRRTINSKILRIDRVSQNDSGLYECRAASPTTTTTTTTTMGLASANNGDQLRKVVRLIVNGRVGWGHLGGNSKEFREKLEEFGEI